MQARPAAQRKLVYGDLPLFALVSADTRFVPGSSLPRLGRVSMA
jgi:hypothetical protein